MNLKQLFVGLGLALIALVGAELAIPGLLPNPFGEEMVLVLGGATMLYALAVVWARRSEQIDRVEIPHVERRLPTDVPGESLSAILRQFPKIQREHSSWSYTTREGLQDAAIAVLTRYGDCTKAEAREQIEQKRWTDDAVAADFLTGDLEEYGLVTRSVRSRLSIPSKSERAIDRTIDAIVEVAETGQRARGEGTEEATETTVEGAGSEGEQPSAMPDSVAIDPEVPLVAGRSTPDALRETHHWTGVSVVALVCLGLGVIVQQPGVLLAGIVGIGYVAYARSFPTGSVDVSIDRTVSDENPRPEDRIEVTLEITNEGTRLLPDLRVVDGVPATLSVSSGSPRCGTALQPGESETLSYTVQARRGRHEFDPALVLARNLPGSVERAQYPRDELTIPCAPALQPTREPMPLQTKATKYTGIVETDSSGDGHEFHTIREYEPGDPMNRIDWNRRAKTGELTTLELREERAAKVVLAVDVRPSAYVGPTPEADHGVDRSVAAAGRIFARLLDDGHQVGVATLGPAECWIEPNSGKSHRHHVREVLGNDPALSSVPTESDEGAFFWEKQLRQFLPENTQIIVFSPLCDGATVRSVQRFEAYGYPVTVITPDPTADRTPNQRLQRVSRSMFLTDLRQSGVPVFDWGPDEPLEGVLKAGRYVNR
ncbi:DUF7269 family protein [Halovenus marina]|uniref:DUF58 domain-containing protein n=1 Tax=Halovenus marina TaxID=3396621 RepID=UPI003F552549